jgi:hypothetical protein
VCCSPQGYAPENTRFERPDPAIFYGGALVFSRPDQHVAWRGDCLPADPLALIDRIRGAAN